MKKTRLKELLKEAFNKGRDYQYDINPYNGKLKEDSKALSFTKWYNQVKNIEVIHCCTELPIIEELIISEIRRKQQKQVDDEVERFLNGNGTDCRLRGFFSEPKLNE